MVLVVGGHNTVVLGEAARLANTLASRSEQAARASPKGSLRLLCADGAGVLGFVHENAMFHGRKGVLGGVCPWNRPVSWMEGMFWCVCP